MKKLVLLVLLSLSIHAELPRRGAVGLGLAADANRVVVRDAFPNLPAAKAGLKPGDVLLSLNGKAVTTPAEVTGPLSRIKAGESVRVEYLRDGETRTATLTLQEWPRETSDVYDATYGEVSADGNRYRTILAKPKGAGPFPTVFIIQGVGCGSIENPPPGHSYRALIESLARRGIATLRVDKPGIGDSEGGPCAAADFHTEVRAYRAALASLKDAKDVFLFGHSMGGIMAPLVADAAPLRGIAVYGTTYNSWLQYTLENQRRQQRLQGDSFESIAEDERRAEKFVMLFYVQKQPLEKILAENPVYREGFPDDGTFAAGKQGQYFQQLYDVELAKAWKATNVPVLAIWGASDFLTDGQEHEWLAAAVNSWRPGTARYVRLDGIDHFLRKAVDQAASMKNGPAGSEYDDRLAETLAAFVGVRRP